MTDEPDSKGQRTEPEPTKSSDTTADPAGSGSQPAAPSEREPEQSPTIGKSPARAEPADGDGINDDHHDNGGEAGDDDGEDGEIAPIVSGPITVDLSADLRNSLAKELAHKQEDTRTSLALGLLILLCALAILSLILVQFVGLEETTVTEGNKVTKSHTNIRMDAVVQQAQTLIAAVVGLVGSVIGFYFGARSKNGTD